MARADNCVHLYVNNPEWRNDCIIIYSPHSKGYHKGVNRNKPCHIYSNTISPENFPVLSLDNNVLVYPTFLKVDCRLFPGDLKCNHFMPILSDVLKEHKDDFVDLNIDMYELGYTSAHKVAATLCESG